jgi:hypothetical protein
MAKKSIDPKAPIVGDDEGNLIKAGYAATELKEAKKVYAQELKERPEVMANTTFSDFLFEQAALAYIISNEIE